jgi:hypothetical protein
LIFDGGEASDSVSSTLVGFTNIIDEEGPAGGTLPEEEVV